VVAALNHTVTKPVPAEVEELTSFTVFPKLPIEIRLKIWKGASHFQRNLEIFSHPISHYTIVSGAASHAFKLQTSLPPPAILHVNSESRMEALQHYTLAFGTKVDFEDFAFSTPPRIYYNRKSDRVCFTGPVNALSRSAIEEAIMAHKIARLAINVNVPLADSTTSGFEDPAILDLAGTVHNWYHPELTDIVLYVSPRSGRGGYGSRMKFFWPEGDCAGDRMREQMARAFVEKFRKLDKDERIMEAPTEQIRTMSIRMQAIRDFSVEDVQRVRAWAMFGFQIAYCRHQENLRRGKMRLEMTEQYERAGKAVPEMFPFEMAETSHFLVRDRFLVLDSASGSREANQIGLTKEDTGV
jgi:hypothetical protein